MTDHTRMDRQVRVRAYLSYDPSTYRNLVVHVRPGGTIEEAVIDQLPEYGLEIARRYLAIDVQAELDPIPYTGD
jgi:hypothetical protein